MDLPMHVHDHSDRFIIVIKGRGFFHVTDESDKLFADSLGLLDAWEDVELYCVQVVKTDFSSDDDEDE